LNRFTEGILRIFQELRAKAHILSDDISRMIDFDFAALLMVIAITLVVTGFFVENFTFLLFGSLGFLIVYFGLALCVIAFVLLIVEIAVSNPTDRK
jgi:uncharacterized Tic20 family protein